MLARSVGWWVSFHFQEKPVPQSFNPELARQWRDRLRRFEQSGFNVAEFCQIEDYSVASFYRWRKKLSTDSLDDRAACFVPVEVPIHTLQAADSDRLHRRCSQGDEHGLQIELPGGALARLGRDASDQEQCRLIRNVVQTLREVTS